MINIECEYCGTEFTAERISRKYCTHSCRSMANRQRRQNEEIELVQEKQNAAYEEQMSKINAALAALKLKSDEENRKLKEKLEADEKQRRAVKAKKRAIDSEKKFQEATAKINMIFLGSIALLGAVNQHFNPVENTISDIKAPEAAFYPDAFIVPQNEDSPNIMSDKPNLVEEQ